MPSTRTARALERRRPALIRPSQRRCAGADCTGDRLLGLHIYTSRPCPEMRTCRDAVRPGARALICRLPAGAPALLSGHCERLWLLPRAEVLAEVVPEVPVLCEPQGGMPEQAGSLRWHRGSRYRVHPGPKAPAGWAFGLCEPAKAGLSSSYDFTSRPDRLASVVV
jgi:hypothetical protein